jgi:hypothetical protein
MAARLVGVLAIIRRAFLPQPDGGVAYTATYTGTCSGTGTLSKFVVKVLSGTV